MCVCVYEEGLVGLFVRVRMSLSKSGTGARQELEDMKQLNEFTDRRDSVGPFSNLGKIEALL